MEAIQFSLVSYMFHFFLIISLFNLIYFFFAVTLQKCLRKTRNARGQVILARVNIDS